MRIRSIKPEFFRSDDIDALSIPDRLLFIGLWLYVDDSGVGVDKESAIAADLFAGDLAHEPHETSVRVHGGLMRLAERGLITRYSVAGRRFLAITNWKKHQKINRPSATRYPGPTSENAVPHGGLSEDSVSTHAESTVGTGEQGNRGVTTLAAADASPESPAADAAPTVDDDFTDFWAAYPRKEKKPAALRAYKALRRKRTSHDTVMTGLRKHLAVWEQNGIQRQYIPHPATWLNNEAFNDDIGQTSLSVVPDLKTSFDEIRGEADAEYAGRLINRWYVEPAQPPSDTTPVQAWTRSRAVEFIDAHADEIRAALTPQRRTG